jgi:nitric oxide reductase NorD protein
MRDLLEPEETVGRFWHRWIGAAASYPRHPQAAAMLDPLRGRLRVFFRALGGPGGVRLAACSHTTSRHRLRLRERLGLGEGERLELARLDAEALLLPARIDCFPDPDLNEALYFWLAAFLAHAVPANRPADPLQADIAILRLAHRTTRRVLDECPGLRSCHAALAEALREMRPRRALPATEAAMEEAVLHLIGGAFPGSAAGRQIAAVVLGPGRGLDGFRAPRGYQPFLPVPLWGEAGGRGSRASSAPGEEPGGGCEPGDDTKRRKATRRRFDQAEREDPLMLNPFSSLLSLAEMVNVNRSVEDDDAESARKAAEDMDEMAVDGHRRRAATRLHFDLDLAPEAVSTTPLTAEHTYPEWDYTRQCYHPDHCRVIAQTADEEGEDWRADAAARRRIRAVRRHFEALRPKRQVFAAQSDGNDLDLSALVRSQADRRAGGPGSDRVYLQARNTARDLAVALLMDVSLSTDSWDVNRRVLDVEKEALTALIHGLAACGDDHAVYTFTSRKRSWVRVETVKGFDEPLDGRVERRIQALKPGYYTRIGAALRHVTTCLAERPNRHRLILLLTDGKPNDLDHYEGRYGVEDTRKAIREARQHGLAVFGVTIDKKAQDYFPYLFGRGAYAIVSRAERLTAALPAIYRQLVG